MTIDWDAINNIWLDVRFRGLTRPGMVLRRESANDPKRTLVCWGSSLDLVKVVY